MGGFIGEEAFEKGSKSKCSSHVSLSTAVGMQLYRALVSLDETEEEDGMGAGLRIGRNSRVMSCGEGI